MTIIKDWHHHENSEQWTQVLEDAEGPDEYITAPGRLFLLTRKLTPEEFTPLDDMETACACELEYDGKRSLRVDQPLVLIVHHYLDSLGD